MTSVAGAHADRRLIADGLRRLGVRKGDHIVVHSSLKAFGHVEGGADTVIDALLDAVGDSGTIIMPSHTDCNDKDVDAYDPETTPVRKNIGIIPDTFWRRPDVRRGTHPPRHPWAAKGALADELIDISESRPIGAKHVAGILNRLAEIDGKILLLGCSHNSNTSVHTAEAAAVSEVEGVLKSRAEFLPNFNEIDEPLTKSGRQAIGPIKNAEVRFLSSRDLFNMVREIYVEKYRGTEFHQVDYQNPATDATNNT